ncbi:MAG: hypothetical protein K0R17_3510 [Rariglobus sp.]|jgi:hypothetical protein|nr:hypothetical protein [Rariglobus sp.]
MNIPENDPLFLRFLDPWYSEADRKRKNWDATRPDMLTISGYVGASPDDLQILVLEGQNESKARIERMLAACRSDWPTYLNLSGGIGIDLDWIDAFDAYYDRKKVSEIIDKSDPTDFSNDYLILVCEFGAALGHVLQRMEPRLNWVYDWPYWESSLVDTQTGTIIPTFHWAVKKFSDYGIDDGFAAKLEMCVSVLNENHRG